MVRFASVLYLFALGAFLLPYPAADASPVAATLEDGGLAEEVLPGDQSTPDLDDAARSSRAEREHAALPPLNELRGITSVSLQATGLLDYLAPFLARDAGLVIQWRAVDDHRALQLARSGDGDILLTAMPDRENRLRHQGHADARLEIMRDGYLLAGPKADPAGTRNADLPDALRAIADAGAPFVSRGDGSATHKRERALWKKADRQVRDDRNGYVESGQGALPTLAIADALGAYAVTDKASFLTYRATHPTALTVLAENQPSLIRIWSLLLLTPPADAPDAAARALRALTAHSLLEWWQKPSTRELVSRFTREGEPVFTPLPPQPEAPATE